MSSIIYNKGFEMQLSHNFYVYTSPDSPPGNEFKVNKDFEILPTVECADLMKSGRLRFIRTGQGFVVFYQSYLDEVPLVPVQKPLVKLSDGAEFVFVVKMPTDPTAFLTNVSDWNVGSKTYTAEKLFMMEATVGNTGNPETVALTASLANSVKPPLFSYFFQPTGGYTGLADVVVYDNATPTPNEVFRIDDVPYNTVTHGYSVEIDLTEEPKGFYTLKAFQANTTTQIHITDFYVDANLAIQNIFGIIRIKYNTIDRLYETISDPADFKTFEYAFLSRSVYWRYYIVAQNLPGDFFDTYDLTVFDQNTTPAPVAFLASNPSTDGQPYGQPDANVRINGLDTVILTSTTKIPYTENPRQKMNLFKHLTSTVTDTKIADNLPNANVIGIDSDQLGAAQTPPTITEDIAEIFVII